MRRAKRRGIEAQRKKPPSLSRATNALIGNEEQKGKQMKEKKKNREQVPSLATLYYSVASYNAQGSYGESILLTPSGPQGYSLI